MEFQESNDDANVENIKCILNVLDDFLVLSGLGINKAKMKLNLFGRQEDKSILAERVGIKLCTKFNLLGNDFDQYLEEIQLHFDKVVSTPILFGRMFIKGSKSAQQIT